MRCAHPMRYFKWLAVFLVFILCYQCATNLDFHVRKRVLDNLKMADVYNALFADSVATSPLREETSGFTSHFDNWVKNLTRNYDSRAAAAMRNSSRSNGKPLRQPILSPPGDVVHECRSLFTVSEIPREEFYLKYSRSENRNGNATGYTKYSRPNFPSVIRRPSRVFNRDFILAAAAVGNLRQMRESRTSITNILEYHRLGLLLPRLLTFEDDLRNDQNDSEEDDHETTESDSEKPKGGPPILTGKSRILAAGGTLPYVPCAIAPYDNTQDIIACFQERIRRKGDLWIQFMGDSKVRGVMFELIERLDHHYQFRVIYSETDLWSAVKNTKFKTDTDVYSEVEPNLRIQFCFASFAQPNKSLIKHLREVKILKKWASGHEYPPDVFIIGYASWLLHQVLNGKSATFETLDMQHNIHQVVVPLLEQISSKTRVLVLPQSRMRRTGDKFNIYMNNIWGDPIYDWNETLFLYELYKFRESHRSKSARPHSSVEVVRQRSPESLTGSSPASEGQRTPPLASESNSATDDYARSHFSRDQLVPTETDSGLWWWDSILPLNLASLSECQRLHLRSGHHPLFNSSELLCNDSQHSGRITNRDLITMLFNLMCNSISGAPREFCCS